MVVLALALQAQRDLGALGYDCTPSEKAYVPMHTVIGEGPKDVRTYLTHLADNDIAFIPKTMSNARARRTVARWLSPITHHAVVSACWTRAATRTHLPTYTT